MAAPLGYRKWLSAAYFVMMAVCLVLGVNTLRHFNGPKVNQLLFAAVYFVLALFFALRSWRYRQPPPNQGGQA